MEQYLDYVDAKRAAAGVTEDKGPIEVVYVFRNLGTMTGGDIHIEKHRDSYYFRYEENDVHSNFRIREFWYAGQQKRIEIWVYGKHTCICMESHDMENGKIIASRGGITFEKKGADCIIQLRNNFRAEVITTNETMRTAVGRLEGQTVHYSFGLGVRPLRYCPVTNQIIILPRNYPRYWTSYYHAFKAQYDTYIDLEAVCHFDFHRKNNTIEGNFVRRLKRCMRRWLIKAHKAKVRAVLVKPLAAVVCSYL